MPTHTAPSQPQNPCTEMAPQGSSILVTRSLNSTPMHTTIPANTPIATAELGDTKAHGAVIATKPASIPLQAMVTSGLPNMKSQRSRAAAEPATATALLLWYFMFGKPD